MHNRRKSRKSDLFWTTVRQNKDSDIRSNFCDYIVVQIKEIML